MSSRSDFEDGVEGLRGFASLAVLYTHFLWSNDLDPGYTLPQGWMIFECSQGAVLLFFILSGYVIGLTNRRPFSLPNWRSYLWRRIVRIVPLCWIALLLSALVRSTPPDVLLGNLFFLQNNIPYGDWQVPVIAANTNVWTLNYEALYYLLFILCWVTPRAWPVWTGVAAVLSVAGWALQGNWGPLVACYAVGWIFWLTGYGLSRVGTVSNAEGVVSRLPWISILLFWIVTWQHKPFWNLARRFDLLPRDHEWAWLNYTFLDIVPASLVLMLAASGRRPRLTRPLYWIAALVPTLYVAWTLLRGRESLWAPSHHLVFCLLAWALWRWRPDGCRAWARLAWFGSISYALYIFHRPVQWFLKDADWLSSGTVLSYILRLFLALTATFVLSWFAEVRMQPWLRERLVRRLTSTATS